MLEKEPESEDLSEVLLLRKACALPCPYTDIELARGNLESTISIM